MRIICKPTPKKELIKYDDDLCETIVLEDGSVPLGHYIGKMIFTPTELDLVTSFPKVRFVTEHGSEFYETLPRYMAMLIQRIDRYCFTYEGKLVMYNPEDDSECWEGIIEPQFHYQLICAHALKGNWDEVKKLIYQTNIWYRFFTDFYNNNACRIKSVLKNSIKELNEKGYITPNIRPW